MQFQEARARPPTSAGCDLSCAVNGIVGELGCKTSAWSAGPAYNARSFPGDFKNAVEHSESGGSLPGQGQAVHLGLYLKEVPIKRLLSWTKTQVMLPFQGFQE